MRPGAETGVNRWTHRSASRVLVGRDDVLAHLDSLLDEAVAAGRLITTLVEGPAGIGKTRVVNAFADHVVGRRGDVLVGHCVAQGDLALPYAPVVDLLGTLAEREGPAAVRRWSGPAGVELGRLVPSLGAPGEGSAPSHAGSSRLFQALSALLGQLSSARPLVVVVEDVHWVDTSTRELLALLARQQRGPILLLLTLRDDESPLPPGLTRYLAELARHGDQRIRLAPLTRDQQALQISDIRGVPPHRALLDDVYARAEGNPFFAEELLALGEREGRSLPVTVRDLLLARLDSLRPSTRQLLRTASIAGREFTHLLLEAVADVAGSRLEAALRESVDAHVLEGRGDSLMFRHALLQEAIAASLLPGEAARTHRRLAVALTERPELAGAGYGGVAGRIARHWDAAGDREQALVTAVAAGREAYGALAFAESLAHYERALELVRTLPEAGSLLDVPEARLLRWAAEVAHLAAHPDRALDLVREAIALTDPDDVHLRGWLHERLGRYLWMAGDGKGALAAYQEAVRLVPAEPPSRSRAAVLSGLSQILMLADRYAESERYARQAIEVARQVPDGLSIEGHARCNLGVDLAASGRLDDGVAELRTALRIAEDEFDDVDENARALVNLGSVLIQYGRAEEAAETALESVRVGDALGLRRRKGVWCRCDAAQVLLFLGRFEEAEGLLDEARELDPQGVDAIRTDLVEGQLHLRRGSFEEARSVLERARGGSERLLDPQLIGPLFAALVETVTWQDELSTARDLVIEGLDRLGPTSAHPFYESTLLAAAVRSTVLGGDGAADVDGWLDRARTGLAASPIEVPHAAADLATAMAERTGGTAAWQTAAGCWDGLGERYRATYARLRVVECLLEDGQQRDAAEEQLRSVVAGAHEIGARHLLELAESLGRRSRLRVGTQAPTDNPHRLTAREREVLAHVAEGLSDRAIGTRLFISHRTVERHVSSLLAKLNAGRRTELIATAHREGLLTDGGDGDQDIVRRAVR